MRLFMQNRNRHNTPAAMPKFAESATVFHRPERVALLLGAPPERNEGVVCARCARQAPGLTVGGVGTWREAPGPRTGAAPWFEALVSARRFEQRAVLSCNARQEQALRRSNPETSEFDSFRTSSSLPNRDHSLNKRAPRPHQRTIRTFVGATGAGGGGGGGGVVGEPNKVEPTSLPSVALFFPREPAASWNPAHVVGLLPPTNVGEPEIVLVLFTTELCASMRLFE